MVSGDGSIAALGHAALPFCLLTFWSALFGRILLFSKRKAAHPFVVPEGAAGMDGAFALDLTIQEKIKKPLGIQNACGAASGAERFRSFEVSTMPGLPPGATGAGKPQQALAFGQGWLAFGLENAGNLFGCSAGEHTGRHASTSDKMVGKKGSASLQPGLYQGPAALSRGQGVNPSPGGPPGGRYFRKCGATPTGTSPARRGGFGRKGCRRAPSWPGRRRSGSCGQAR